MTRLLGPDGLRNPGGQLAWHIPGHATVTLAVLNSDGETAASFRSDDSGDIHGGTPAGTGLRGPQDLLFVPRIATTWTTGDRHTWNAGISGALGPNNSGASAATQIYGVDWDWHWKLADAESDFPFVTWQTEFLFRRYEAAETLWDWGGYTQLLWGYRRGWVAGLRGEYVSANNAAFASDLRLDRTRLSPNLTWQPVDFAKLRWQYNYDRIQQWGDEHSVWMQVEFQLGEH
jgi:hypothetical protein